MSDAWVFLTEFLRAPVRVGSVTPSGRALSDRVARAAGIAPGHLVVELGGGTGVVTRAVARACPDATVVSLEPSARLADALRATTTAEVHAEAADRALPERLAAWGHGPADRVVSGLPWTLWPDDVQADVLDGVVGALRPGGRFATYTYVTSWALPAEARFRAALSARFTRVWTTEVVWANLPPAVVVVGDGPVASRPVGWHAAAG